MISEVKGACSDTAPMKLLKGLYYIMVSRFVVTINLNQVVVILGENQRNKDEKTEQYMSIAQVHFHSQYGPTTFESDIALFKFTKQAIYTDYIIPVCLPTTSADFKLSRAGNTARISGWGARKTNKTRPTKRLHTVQVPTIAHKKCQQNHPTYIISANMLCAGRTNGKADACQGDSGGPLTVENRATGKQVLVGIVSWGEERCGVKNKYGVYTKVQNFLSWINTHITKV